MPPDEGDIHTGQRAQGRHADHRAAAIVPDPNARVLGALQLLESATEFILLPGAHPAPPRRRAGDQGTATKRLLAK